MALFDYGKIQIQASKNPEKRYGSWKGGLNTLQSATKIADNELAVAENIQLIEDGIISTRDGQQYFGNNTGLASVTNGKHFVKSDGSGQIVVTGGQYLKKYNFSTKNFDDIPTSPTFTVGLDCSLVQAYDKLFINNGIDAFCYYDGSNFVLYNSVSTPTGFTNSNLAKNGTHTGGTTTFSYKLSAYNNAGETLTSVSAQITNCVATLTTTNSITITFPALPTGAVGFNIYGRRNNGETFLARIDGSTATFLDDGSITQSQVFFPPEENTTAGKKGKYMVFASSTLFVAGDPGNPSRVYFSGGGSQNIANFGVGSGGGYVDISKSDGDYVTGLVEYQNSVFVFKNNSIWSLTFNGGAVPTVQLITRSSGCIAPKTIKVVENDIFYLSYKGLYVVGNQPNYVGVIRTNELSAKIRPTIQTLSKSRLQNATAYYYINKYVLYVTSGGNTYNDSTITYDRERLAFYTGTNFNVRSLFNYTDTTSNRILLAGQDNGGAVVQLYTGSDDFGSPIPIRIALKQENMGFFEILKVFRRRAIHFRDTVGIINLKLVTDGNTVQKSYSIPLNTTQLGTNSGVWGDLLWGSAPIITSVSTLSDVTKRLVELFKAKSEQLQIVKTDFGGFNLLDYKFEAKLKSKTTFPNSERVTGTAQSSPVTIYLTIDGGTT